MIKRQNTENKQRAEERRNDISFESGMGKLLVYPGAYVGSIISDFASSRTVDGGEDWGQETQGNDIIGQKLKQIIASRSSDGEFDRSGSPSNQSFGQRIVSDVTVSIPWSVIDDWGDLNGPESLKIAGMRLAALAKTITAVSAHLKEEDLNAFVLRFLLQSTESVTQRSKRDFPE